MYDLRFLFFAFLRLYPFLAILPLLSYSEKALQEANTSYQQGETAVSFEERKQAFNRALYLYHAIEKEIDSPVAALNQAIGDTYFQLNEFAWAILYYQRALKEGSPSSSLLIHLKNAQQHVGLSSDLSISQSKAWIPSFLNFSSEPKFFVWILLLTFFVCSLALWVSSIWIRRLALLCIFSLGMGIGHSLFLYYFTPIEGILVASTGFYRLPDWDQPQLTRDPLLAGSKVKVLQITNEREWVKIMSTDNVVGYVPLSNLRLI